MEWTRENITDHPLFHAAHDYYVMACAGFNAAGEGPGEMPLWEDLTDQAQRLVARELARAMQGVVTQLVLGLIAGEGFIK